MDSSCRRDQFAWHRGSWPRIVSHDGNTRLSRLCDKTLGWLEPFWWKTTAKDMWSTRGLCFSRESTSASSINNANNNGLRDQNQAWISGVEEVGVAGVPCSLPRGCSKRSEKGVENQGITKNDTSFKTSKQIEPQKTSQTRRIQCLWCSISHSLDIRVGSTEPR